MKPFTPPFCARKGCRHHRLPTGTAYADFIPWGRYQTKAFGQVPRFRCLSCGKTFSRQTFRTDYYAKKVIDYGDLVHGLSSCESLSAMGRALRASTDTVSNRLARAARQVLAFESVQAAARRPSEDLVADGFESFCRSQYFPNNITLLVGADSQFVYAADHVSLRRKGRMTARQRRRREAIDLLWRPPKGAIEDSFSRIALECSRLLGEEGRPRLSLSTDEHQAYPRGLRSSPHVKLLLDSGVLAHRRLSSRVARTRDNPLFPVNYLDREIRKDLHEHVRETTCFGRNVNRQMERLTVYLYCHNYLKPHRAREASRSHAEVAGYDPLWIATRKARLWRDRAWLSLTSLNGMMEETWLRLRQTPPLASRDRVPAYAFM